MSKQRRLSAAIRAALVATFLLPAAPVYAASVEIPITTNEAREHILPNVRINGVLTVNFVLDTGATDIILPVEVIDALIASGTLDGHTIHSVPGAHLVLADGRRIPVVMTTIQKLEIGRVVVTNVPVVISPKGADALLGQRFLRLQDSYSIDNKRQLLVVTSHDFDGAAPSPIASIQAILDKALQGKRQVDDDAPFMDPHFHSKSRSSQSK